MTKASDIENALDIVFKAVVKPDVIIVDDIVTNEINRIVERKKIMKLSDALKIALESKNKQAHRVAPGTKRARQLLAKQGNGRGVVVPKKEATLRDTGFEHESTNTGRFSGTEPDSKTDI